MWFMPRSHFWTTSIVVLVLLVLLGLLPAFSSGVAQASTEKVINSFQGGADGAYPFSHLTVDSAGNLYGTTSEGGLKNKYCSPNCGTVFELQRLTHGWQKHVIYKFAGGSDGWYPVGGLIVDAAGDLFGMTVNGGTYSNGTVFKLAPSLGGTWTESVIYSFPGGNLEFPDTDLVFDTKGNLYGTTPGPGDGYCTVYYYCGAVFELTPGSKGWTETTIYQFGGSPDGAIPSSGLVLDSSGNLYGITGWGGTGLCRELGIPGCGTLFELTPDGQGGWTESMAYNFVLGGGNGVLPSGELAINQGDFLAATVAGGDGLGSIVELSNSPKYGWQQNVLHRFFGAKLDGYSPAGKLYMDRKGDLWGVTTKGGAGQGNVFELQHVTGVWKNTVVHVFKGTPDGASPQSGLISDSQGRLYGTTKAGGTGTACSGGCGTVYEIVP